MHFLGPGQKKPPYNLTYSKFGDLFLDFKTTRSFVEMRVRLQYYAGDIFIAFNPRLTFQIIRARNLLFNYADAPDTFVECFIKDSMSEKIRQRKKTNLIRQNINPDYNYIVTYTVSSNHLVDSPNK